MRNFLNSLKGRRRYIFGGAYLGALLASHIYEFTLPAKPISADKKTIFVSAIQDDTATNTQIRLAYKEFGNSADPNSVPIVLIHGSPGDGSVFDAFEKTLKTDRRIIVPDLPGFGDSTHRIPDYSFRAHAYYILELLNQLNISQADFLAFSMGGGVAIELERIAPGRIRSFTFLSAIGVQEYELLGEYNINHAIHGVQLFAFWCVRNLLPHFGIIGDEAISYSRNFYDSDQRPLRETLTRIEVPFLIIHGIHDPLVPIEVARENARLVPQSKLVEIDDNHFYVFMRPEKAAPLFLDFLSSVDSGKAQTRGTAHPMRILVSAQPFQAKMLAATGATALVFFLLLALSTLFSEDLTCIGAGVLVAQGRIGMLLAVSSCFFGIFVGDILLFAAGRSFGRRALRIFPFRWLIKEWQIDAGSEWLQRRGSWAIFLSRFTPGLRLPIYFVAGVLRTSFLKFALLFFLAAAIWTPMIVYASAMLGGELISRTFLNGNYWFAFVAAVISIYLLIHFAIRAATWRGRTLLLGAWLQIRHWEFWRWQFFYIPVFLYIAWLALRFRSISIFTCANPAIPEGGFVGESKFHILNLLSDSPSASSNLLRTEYLAKELTSAEKLVASEKFIRENELSFPVVLKPDAGQRGADVSIIHSWAQLGSEIAKCSRDFLLQEFASGDEFSVFYTRSPDDENGKIFSITKKAFPKVVGDGVSTLEKLILKDPRAVALAKSYFAQNRSRLDEIIPMGESVTIIEIGTHSRGAIFRDGAELKTPALEKKIDSICREVHGFYFGRFDIRANSAEEFMRAEHFKIVELNGVTSESTNIYDPKHTIIDAYRILFAQWKLAFDIGAQNRGRGAKSTPLRRIVKLIFTEEY